MGRKYRLLMLFMSKISEAGKAESTNGDATTQHNGSPTQTIMEDAITIFDEISHHYDSDIFEPGQWSNVQTCLRCHAVLAPLRKGDRTLAEVKTSLSD